MSPNCPEDWLALGENCYQLTPTGVNNTGAEAQCQALNKTAKLAIFRDHEDKRISEHFLNVEVWLGISAQGDGVSHFNLSRPSIEALVESTL